MCLRKFMVVNLVSGIEKVSVKTGVVDFEVTNSAASEPALVLIPDSKDIRPGLLSRLHIHY